MIKGTSQPYCTFRRKSSEFSTAITGRSYTKRLLASSSAGVCLQTTQGDVSVTSAATSGWKGRSWLPLPACFQDLTEAIWPSPITCSCCLLKVKARRRGEGYAVQMQRKKKSCSITFTTNKQLTVWKLPFSKSIPCTNHQINHGISEYLLRKTNDFARELVMWKYKNTFTKLPTQSQR